MPSQPPTRHRLTALGIGIGVAAVVLVKALTDAIVEICETKPEGTKVVIEEIPRGNWASGGVLLSAR